MQINPSHGPRIPIIDVTDLYHPHQDPGDNFDLIAPYAFPEIDLRAVILDVTESFRSPSSEREERWRDGMGARDPGFIPVTQLNYIFNRNVPAAVSPFTQMEHPGDPMENVPCFQQSGVELLIRILRESTEPVHILVFGSCRAVAAAFNREPELFFRKTACLHLCVGTTSGELFDVDWDKSRRLPLQPGSRGYLEWNVDLDPHACVRLLRSGLPIALYPCATENGPFSMDRHNTYYCMPDLRFVDEMHPKLRNYLRYAFNHTMRNDYLRAMDEPPEGSVSRLNEGVHHVWETAVWLMVSGRKLVRLKNGGYRMLQPGDITDQHTVIRNELRNSRLTVQDTGRFHFELTDEPSNVRIFERALAESREAFTEALQHFYLTIRPDQ